MCTGRIETDVESIPGDGRKESGRIRGMRDLCSNAGAEVIKSEIGRMVGSHVEQPNERVRELVRSIVPGKIEEDTQAPLRQEGRLDADCHRVLVWRAERIDGDQLVVENELTSDVTGPDIEAL